ncbi:hypothetical protein MKX08_002456 [Trichoderma sp. CBMAI-0020]|nr:hypothetical protein MKX08_002456 [Trichoderma sp. CBMAI-0020]
MQFSIAAIVPFLASANAIISGIAVPETIKPGTPFELIITTENYIQAVNDIAIAVGYGKGDGYPGCLGTVLGSFYLGPENSNIITNITETLTIPAGIAQGDGIISATVYSLYGASQVPTLVNHNVTITVGSETSKTLKSSSNH